MVTGPEARILARLATFPSSLESAWDVPREICLPGLSEYLEWFAQHYMAH